MQKRVFANNERMFPVTMKQFEDVTNEMLTVVNELIAPEFFNSDYMAQIVMSGFHSYDRKTAYYKANEMFEYCINRISNHITHHIVEEIQKRLRMEQAIAKEAGKSLTTDNVVPIAQDEEHA